MFVVWANKPLSDPVYSLNPTRAGKWIVSIWTRGQIVSQDSPISREMEIGQIDKYLKMFPEIRPIRIA